MADEGGVTLRIDANTAAYIAKLSQLADSHEKVTKHVDGWGHAMDHVVSKIAAIAGPLALVEEVARKAGEAFKEWDDDIKKAGESTDILVTKLREATVKTGENRQRVADELMATKGSMSNAEAVGFYSAFRGSAPDSAKNITAGRIGAAGAQAQAAGYDLNEFATVSGNLYGAAGGKAFDQAAMLEHLLGGDAGEASALIKKTSAQMGALGPEAMNELMPYLVASAKAKDRRFSFVRGATENLRPGQSMTAALQAGRLKGGPLAQSIFANLPAAQMDIAGSGGALASAAAAAQDDESARKVLETKTVKSQAESANLSAEGERAEEIAYAEANRDLYRQKHRIGAFFNSFAPDTTRHLYGRGSKIDVELHQPEVQPDTYTPGTTSAAGYGEVGGETMPGFYTPKSAAQLLEEQNAILREKKLRTDAHPDP